MRSEDDRRGQRWTEEDGEGRRRTEEEMGGRRRIEEDRRGRRRTEEDRRGRRRAEEDGGVQRRPFSGRSRPEEAVGWRRPAVVTASGRRGSGRDAPMTTTAAAAAAAAGRADWNGPESAAAADTATAGTDSGRSCGREAKSPTLDIRSGTRHRMDTRNILPSYLPHPTILPTYLMDFDKIKIGSVAILGICKNPVSLIQILMAHWEHTPNRCDLALPTPSEINSCVGTRIQETRQIGPLGRY